MWQKEEIPKKEGILKKEKKEKKEKIAKKERFQNSQYGIFFLFPFLFDLSTNKKFYFLICTKKN